MKGQGSQGPDDSDEDSPWPLTRRDDLANLTLRDVLLQAAQQPTPIDDEDTVQIGIRVAPIGFRVIVRTLAREFRTSRTRLMRHALDHGMAKLDEDPSIIGLKDAFDRLNADSMSSGDQDALARLDQVGAYNFKHHQSVHTTLAVSRRTAARISDLAMACGIPQPRLAIVVILISILSLPNSRRYRDALQDELDAFHKHVRYRRRVLLMRREP